MLLSQYIEKGGANMDEDSYCNKCKAVKKIVFGLLVLLNAFWWPMWTGVDGWVAFFGVLFVLKGIVCLVKPACGCTQTCPTTKKKK